MKNHKKTLLISAYHGWVFRNLLSGRIPELLAQHGVHVVVCVPPDKELYTKNLLGDWAQVLVFDVEPIIADVWNKRWHRLGFILERTTYVRDQRLERLDRNRNLFGYVNYWWVAILSAVLSRLPWVVQAYRILDYYMSPRNAVAGIFAKFKPDVVMAGDLFGEADALFLRNAKEAGITTIGMVRSWDNTTTKGILRIIPDRIIANSVTVQRELIRIHRCRPAQITVVGLPQFDTWLSGPAVSRENFFKHVGLDPAHRMILFAPAGSVLSDTDWQLCQILKDAIREGKLPDNIVFLMRNHPQHPADLSRFEANKHFLIETPGTRTRSGDTKGTTLNPMENDHLRNSVYYAEVVMYVATSLGLDASVYDKPQILVSFDGWEKKPYARSVERYNREDCLASMVACGGTRVVRTAEEWISALNAYMKNPKIDGQGRVCAIECHLAPLDGKASDRVAREIIQLVESIPRSENAGAEVRV